MAAWRSPARTVASSDAARPAAATAAAPNVAAATAAAASDERCRQGTERRSIPNCGVPDRSIPNCGVPDRSIAEPLRASPAAATSAAGRAGARRRCRRGTRPADSVAGTGTHRDEGAAGKRAHSIGHDCSVKRRRLRRPGPRPSRPRRKKRRRRRVSPIPEPRFWCAVIAGLGILGSGTRRPVFQIPPPPADRRSGSHIGGGTAAGETAAADGMAAFGAGVQDPALVGGAERMPKRARGPNAAADKPIAAPDGGRRTAPARSTIR